VVGERPANPNAIVRPASSSDTPGVKADGATITELGATFEPMDDELRTRLGLKSGENGLVVTGVTKEGVMEDAGFQPGMVILEVNNKPATSVEALRKAIDEAKRAKRTKILVAVRIGQITNYRTIDLSDAE
jgi:serine protease Do